MEHNTLKRINFDGLPETIVMPQGQIRFRHYHITLHAIDRFAERCDRPAHEIIMSLNDACVAYADTERRPASRRMITKNMEQGCYVLKNGNTYFIVGHDKDNVNHVVKTVMTAAVMRW